jgi:hypothetical protein
MTIEDRPEQEERLPEIMSRMGPEDREYLAHLLEELGQGLYEMREHLHGLSDDLRSEGERMQSSMDKINYLSSAFRMGGGKPATGAG